MKRKAIETNNEEDWLYFKSSRNAANVALRHSKKEYFTKKFSNNEQNPEKAWRTINDILGQNRKKSTINEIKLPGNTVTSTDELVEVFNDYFNSIDPRLVESVRLMTITSVFGNSLLSNRMITFHSGL